MEGIIIGAIISAIAVIIAALIMRPPKTNGKIQETNYSKEAFNLGYSIVYLTLSSEYEGEKEHRKSFIDKSSRYLKQLKLSKKTIKRYLNLTKQELVSSNSIKKIADAIEKVYGNRPSKAFKLGFFLYMVPLVDNSQYYIDIILELSKQIGLAASINITLKKIRGIVDKTEMANLIRPLLNDISEAL